MPEFLKSLILFLDDNQKMEFYDWLDNCQDAPLQLMNLLIENTNREAKIKHLEEQAEGELIKELWNKLNKSVVDRSSMSLQKL